jgi:hypothetical protein
MSTHAEKPGGKQAAQDLVAEGRALFDAARAEEAHQLSLLGPPSPEEMAEARERMGPRAGELSVVAEARRGRGRPKDSKNKRNKDFRNYILRFGQHPAVTLMQLQNTPTEVLVERSKAIDPPKKQLSYGEANSLRVRAAEALMPYIESKMPVAVELGIDGDFNLLIPGLNITSEDAEAAAAGEFVLEADYVDIDDDEDGEA